MAEDIFPGFDDPSENWSRLPHSMIHALPLIQTVAEAKVILYVLRHTWGYHTASRSISVDEFSHGRRAKGGGRLDNGTGLSEQAVRDGLEKATQHGFMDVFVDDHDRGRVSKTYALKYRMEEEAEETPQPPMTPPNLRGVTPLNLRDDPPKGQTPNEERKKEKKKTERKKLSEASSEPSGVSNSKVIDPEMWEVVAEGLDDKDKRTAASIAKVCRAWQAAGIPPDTAKGLRDAILAATHEDYCLSPTIHTIEVTILDLHKNKYGVEHIEWLVSFWKRENWPGGYPSTAAIRKHIWRAREALGKSSKGNVAKNKASGNVVYFGASVPAFMKDGFVKDEKTGGYVKVSEDLSKQDQLGKESE